MPTRNRRTDFKSRNFVQIFEKPITQLRFLVIHGYIHLQT